MTTTHDETAFILPDDVQAAAFVADMMIENKTPLDAVPYCADAALVLCSVMVSANAGAEALPDLSAYFQSIKRQIIEQCTQATTGRTGAVQ
ncbi:hypothetical protein HW509_14130 [Asaia spathodeae]|uniref:hypothetical protein n=1 Tax=Asaia spathodeae TaxID=657016 RepID=UPI002FC390C5